MNVPDWSRIFPEGDHRWSMGLRPADPANFFAPCDPTGDVVRERAHWLADEPEKYVALLPEAHGCLAETIDLANRWAAANGTSPIARDFVPADTAAQLKDLGCTWEADVVWLAPHADGELRVVGGIVCFPSSWALTEKLGLPMRDVHGPVPGLNLALGGQIERFLAKLASSSAWSRENWSLSRCAERNQHTSRPRAAFDERTPLEEVWIRLEHQLLMRLPTSGAVLFGIRIELVPLAELKSDPAAATNFARILKTMSPEAAAYKNFAVAREHLLEQLSR
ncbi:MAG: hypothetical protein C0483_08825 [Pirellula sp.]|nr:hypothetical protein [Pirellula sp.]